MNIIAYDVLLVLAVFAVYLTVEPSLSDPVLMFKDIWMLALYSLRFIWHYFVCAPIGCITKCCCCCFKRRNELPTEEATYTIDDGEEAEESVDGSRINLTPPVSRRVNPASRNGRVIDRLEDYFNGERSPIIKAKTSLFMVLILTLIILHASHAELVIDTSGESDAAKPLNVKGHIDEIHGPAERMRITSIRTVIIRDHHDWNNDFYNEV